MSIKIRFTLDCEEGYPPIRYELVNAIPISTDSFGLANTPYFVRDISYHDVVRAIKSEQDGIYEFVDVQEESSYTSISIIILDSSMDSYLMDLLRGLNCVIEYGEFGVFRILSVAVPDETNYEMLREQLVALEETEKLSFEELAVAHNLKQSGADPN